MPVELACSECNGRLLVDQFGVVVACPHCAAHLEIPADLDPGGGTAPAPTAAAPAPVSEAPPPSTPAEPAPVLGPVGSEDSQPAASAVPPMVPVEVGEDVDQPAGPSDFPSFDGIEAVDDVPSFPSFDAPQFDSSPLIRTDSQIVGGDAAPVDSETAAPGPDPSASSITIDTSSEPSPEPTPGATPQPASASASVAGTRLAPPPSAGQSPVQPSARHGKRADGRKTLSGLAFQVWLSYTIIVTFLLILLALRYFGTDSSKLESLPDVKPPMSPGGQVGRKFAPENAPMPRGHTLALGETRRFGNINVTPLKVTRGPIEFVNFDTRAPKGEPAGPVLKLWLKFENVSDDQTIAPLDADLVYYRTGYDDLENRPGVHANNFVATPAGKASGDVVLMYDLVIDGNWDVAGQDFDRALGPGDVQTTFIPSDERGLDKLKGPLLWRVHFRKGYSPGGYGVTTLIEVEFTSDDIQTESGSQQRPQGATA